MSGIPLLIAFIIAFAALFLALRELWKIWRES